MSQVAGDFNYVIESFLMFQNAAFYNSEEPDENMADVEENRSLNINSNVGASASICYGRNMTFPRQASSYSHRHELPAVVTEGENYRLSGEVRNTVIHSPFTTIYFLDFHKSLLISYW